MIILKYNMGSFSSPILRVNNQGALVTAQMNSDEDPTDLVNAFSPQEWYSSTGSTIHGSTNRTRRNFGKIWAWVNISSIQSRKCRKILPYMGSYRYEQNI